MKKVIWSVIIAMIITAVVVGMAVYWWQKSLSDSLEQELARCNSGAAAEAALPNKQMSVNQTMRVYLDGGNVHFVDKSGEDKIIATSYNTDEDVVANKRYLEAAFSPDNKFISLLYLGWEWYGTEIYDVSTGQVHNLVDSVSGKQILGGDFRWWELFGDKEYGLRLDVFYDDPSDESVVYDSISASEPWKLKKVATVNLLRE
jgi:hypothetical protein